MYRMSPKTLECVEGFEMKRWRVSTLEVFIKGSQIELQALIHLHNENPSDETIYSQMGVKNSLIRNAMHTLNGIKAGKV